MKYSVCLLLAAASSVFGDFGDPMLSYVDVLSGGRGQRIARDSSGNIYISGIVTSGTFPATPGALQTSYHGGTCVRGLSFGAPCFDVFVAKWNPSGARLLWATYLGGSGDDDLGGMAVDQSGNVYLTGWTSSADFPVTAGALQTQYLGAKIVGSSYEFIGDAFVVKLNSSGTALIYSTYLGGTGSDWANAIAIDNAGNAYITGATTSKDFPVSAAAFQQTNHTATLTGTNVFVTKLNAGGSAVVYSTYLGGNGKR